MLKVHAPAAYKAMGERREGGGGQTARDELNTSSQVPWEGLEQKGRDTGF